ncbi:FAD-dependent monooxygenase [Pelagibacteraceae bacterium]|nr:FAD-dependent monooxygenase [Pelagibacteraceae bacterium]
MKLQKICILGDGLTGLTTALALKNLNVEIDLICKKDNTKKLKDTRVTAISHSNLIFLEKHLKIGLKRNFWSCKKVHLYNENKNKYANFLNIKEDTKFLMHIFENKIYKKILIKEIKKTKNIIIINESVTKINFKSNSIDIKKKKYLYDLIILCLGNKSSLYDQISNNRSIYKDYKEIAFTGSVKHNLKIVNPSQFFLSEGPLAILPYKKNYFSYVWSLNKDFYNLNKKKIDTILSKKIKDTLGKKIKFKLFNKQSFPIRLNLQSRYYRSNVLILGEGLHSIHPFAGQGFNLILRDIIVLKKLINENINLGFTIKNSNILKNFYDSRRAENILLGVGLDLTNNFFRSKNLSFLKNLIISNVSKYNIIKKVSKRISDKGIYF